MGRGNNGRRYRSADATVVWAGRSAGTLRAAALLAALAPVFGAACGGSGEGDPAAPSGSAASLGKTGGDGQRGVAGTLLTHPLEVTVTDAAGAPVPDVEVRFTSAAGRPVPSQGDTDADGRRSARVLLPDREGQVVVTASADGLPDAEFTVEAVAGPPNPYEFPLALSGRHLVDAAGRPIVLNGDAAWGIAVQLDSVGVRTYLDTRVGQGVNTILFRAIDDRFADAAPSDAYGRLPFTDTLAGGQEDFTSLNPAYWSWVEWVVAEARERGVVCLVAPAYLGLRLGEEGWATALEANGAARLTSYGDSLGRRLGSHGNVIWVMGGDAVPAMDGRDVTDEVDAIAAGIEASMPDAIFTAHAGRRTSALDAYDQPWLDINSTYSDTAMGPTDLRRDWHRTDGDGEPPMPSIWIEGYYENEHSTTPEQLRSQMYWSLLGGAVGHVYGAHPVWSFGTPAASGFGDSSSPPYDTWVHALETDVARDLVHVRRLIDTRPMRLLVPDYEGDVVTAGRGSRSGFVAAARASDGSLVIAYLPDRREVTVDMSRITTDRVADASWLDPRTGDMIRIGEFATEGERGFLPPSDTDWLLIIEDAPR